MHFFLFFVVWVSMMNSTTAQVVQFMFTPYDSEDFDPPGTIPQAGNYGTPGARDGSMMWADSSGSIWMFGGKNSSGKD
jgi:hypothetical protein